MAVPVAEALSMWQADLAPLQLYRLATQARQETSRKKSLACNMLGSGGAAAHQPPTHVEQRTQADAGWHAPVVPSVDESCPDTPEGEESLVHLRRAAWDILADSATNKATPARRKLFTQACLHCGLLRKSITRRMRIYGTIGSGRLPPAEPARRALPGSSSTRDKLKFPPELTPKKAYASGTLWITPLCAASPLGPPGGVSR